MLLKASFWHDGILAGTIGVIYVGDININYYIL